MSEDRSHLVGQRGVASPRDKDRSADPHRKVCRYREGDTSWTSNVDYAVYHAPGWEDWQDFRLTLKGMPPDAKAKLLMRWYNENPDRSNLYRVLNYARSQRATWSTTPSMRAINEDLGSLIGR